MQATRLRELYHVLGMCSIETQEFICEDLFRASTGTPYGTKLARLFQDALAQRQGFDAAESAYVPKTRTNTEGRNPVTTALAAVNRLEAKVWSGDVYGFRYLNREIAHLRTEDPEQESCKAWIDCVGISDAGRPVVCEIKWKYDKNAFYGFIQLLTYLSELATKPQMARSRVTKLFDNWDGESESHDLVLLLVNSKPSDARDDLKKSAGELATGFAECLKSPAFAEASRVVGNIACFSARIDEDKSVFVGDVHTDWWIPR